MALARSPAADSQGKGSLFKGIVPVAVGAGPAHAMYFGVYEQAKLAFGANEGDDHHPMATGRRPSRVRQPPCSVIRARLPGLLRSQGCRRCTNGRERLNHPRDPHSCACSLPPPPAVMVALAAFFLLVAAAAGALATLAHDGFMNPIEGAS